MGVTFSVFKSAERVIITHAMGDYHPGGQQIDLVHQDSYIHCAVNIAMIVNKWTKKRSWPLGSIA